MTYFAGIKKYVMTINTASDYPTMDGGDFDTYFLESDDITGPWSMVTYVRSPHPRITITLIDHWYWGALSEGQYSRFSIISANCTMIQRVLNWIWHEVEDSSVFTVIRGRADRQRRVCDTVALLCVRPRPLAPRPTEQQGGTPFIIQRRHFTTAPPSRLRSQSNAKGSTRRLRVQMQAQC